MAKIKGMESWGRDKARKLYADGGAAQEAREAAAKTTRNTRSMPNVFPVGGEPKQDEDTSTFSAGSSFLSKDAPRNVRGLFGGKANGGRLDKRARGGKIQKKDAGGEVQTIPLHPDAKYLSTSRPQQNLPLRYSSKQGRGPISQGGMDTWVQMGGKRENYKRGGRASGGKADDVLTEGAKLPKGGSGLLQYGGVKGAGDVIKADKRRAMVGKGDIDYAKGGRKGCS